MLSENLLKKFGIGPADPVLLINPPEGVRKALGEILPPAAQLLKSPGREPIALVLWWPAAIQDLAESLAALVRHIRPDGAVWLLMPKKKSAGARGIDFTWEQMQAAALQTDLVDNKVASFSETDYGTRFVIRRERRHKYST